MRVLGLLLGSFGVDRFYKGDIGLGIAKLLLSLIIIGFIWVIVDLFIVWKGIKKDNLKSYTRSFCFAGCDNAQ